jgi:four helix bundle protein
VIDMMPHERLEAWKLCHRLVLEVYAVTRDWPASERYGLTSQARKAALSAPINLAEGAAKRGPREFRRFLDISVGSLAELHYVPFVARELGFLSAEGFQRVQDLREEAGKAVWGLYRFMRDKARLPL